MKEIPEILRAIARKEGIETLEVRHSDELDFHDLDVSSIRRMLIAAYEAGALMQRNEDRYGRGK